MADYSEQQLIAALRKADAAGDVPAARAIAGRIQSMRAGAPKPKTVEELTPGLSLDPTEGRNNFGAGVGMSLRNSALGIIQAAASGDFPGSPAAPIRKAARFIGVNVPKNPLEQWADRKLAENRVADAALNANQSGFAGNVTGTVAQLVGPGAVLKMASAVPRFSAAAPQLNIAASAFLPNSVKGAAIQGGATGAVQPVHTGESRDTNTGVGLLGGAVGGALPRVAGAALRGANRILEPLTDRGIENIAGRTILRFADNPALRQLDDPVLGVAPSLAEATLDPGIAQLQRAAFTKESKIASALYKSRVAANEARLAAMQPFAGTPARREAAMEAIGKAENAAYDKVRRAVGVDVNPVVAKIDAVLMGPQGKRAAVRSSMNDVRRALYQGGDDSALETSADQLLGARGVIADLLAGGGENQSGRLAQAELIAVRSALDDAIRKAAPEIDAALDARRIGMRPVNEMDTVNELIQRASVPIATPEGGTARSIQPSAFLRPTEDLDKLARAGTGFKKAQADNVLSPEAQKNIEGIRIGLARQQFADNAAKAAGSPTAQFLAGQNVIDAVLGQPKGITSGVANMLAAAMDKPYAFVGVPQRLDAVLARVLTSPAEAQAILSRLPSPDRVLIEQAIGKLTAPTATSVASAKNR